MREGERAIIDGNSRKSSDFMREIDKVLDGMIYLRGSSKAIQPFVRHIAKDSILGAKNIRQG